MISLLKKIKRLFSQKRFGGKYGNVHYQFTRDLEYLFVKSKPSCWMKDVTEDVTYRMLAFFWTKYQMADKTYVLSEEEFKQAIEISKLTINEHLTVIIKLPPPDQPTESYFVGFVSIFEEKEDYHTAFFTLEKGVRTKNMFCCWKGETHIIFDKTESTQKDTFIKLIEKHLNKYISEL